jgi:phosphohistidine phosphatase
MRTLHLLRHAKSSWDHPGLADHDRPLSGRGRQAGGQLADYLRRSGYRPGLVICSSALRARQTLDLIAGGVGVGVPVRIEEQLYTADADDVWNLVRQLPDHADAGAHAGAHTSSADPSVGAEIDEVLVIGHNPTLHELAVSLACEGDDELRSRLRAKLPTGALVTIVWPDDSWSTLRRSSAALHGYVRPRDL